VRPPSQKLEPARPALHWRNEPMIRYSTVQYSTVQYSPVQYGVRSTVQWHRHRDPLHHPTYSTPFSLPSPLVFRRPCSWLSFRHSRCGVAGSCSIFSLPCALHFPVHRSCFPYRIPFPIAALRQYPVPMLAYLQLAENALAGRLLYSPTPARLILLHRRRVDSISDFISMASWSCCHC